MNVRLDIEYIGTNFCGWQKQKTTPTIQDELEKSLKKIFVEKIILLASGRTDSGVHAYNQVANFYVEDSLKMNMVQLKNKLNFLLDKNIKIKRCTRVSDEFHSQHSAKEKTYLYRIKTFEPCSVFEENRFWFIKRELNIDAIEKISKIFIGEKDFKKFCKTGYSGSTTIRKIKKISIKKKSNYIDIFISGNGFLRGMVRLIVGCLIKYEQGGIKESDIKLAINNKKELKLRLSAPAKGLYLYNVKY